jgi:amino acid transporter
MSEHEFEEKYPILYALYMVAGVAFAIGCLVAIGPIVVIGGLLWDVARILWSLVRKEPRLPERYSGEERK